jgi:hypothetical protein
MDNKKFYDGKKHYDVFELSDEDIHSHLNLNIKNINKLLSIKMYPNKIGDLNISIADVSDSFNLIQINFYYGFEECNRDMIAMIYKKPIAYYIDSLNFIQYIWPLRFNDTSPNLYFNKTMAETPNKFMDLLIERLKISLEYDSLPF